MISNEITGLLLRTKSVYTRQAGHVTVCRKVTLMEFCFSTAGAPHIPSVAFPGPLPVHMQMPGYVVTCHSVCVAASFSVLVMHLGRTQKVTLT